MLEIIQLVWSFDTELPRLVQAAALAYPLPHDGLSSIRAVRLFGNFVVFAGNVFHVCIIWDWTMDSWAWIRAPGGEPNREGVPTFFLINGKNSNALP